MQFRRSGVLKKLLAAASAWAGAPMPRFNATQATVVSAIMQQPRILVAIACLLMIATNLSAAPVLRATDLRTEYRTNPIGIAETKPRLSWVLKSEDGKVRGQRQTAYQVLVASTRQQLKENAGDLWDSGKVQSDETIQIEYGGKALTAGQRAYWSVKTWNAAGEESPWSEPATWSVGLIEEKDWKAKWIGYDEPEPAPATATTAAGKADPLSLDKLSWVWTDEGDPTKKAPKGTRYFATSIAIKGDAKISKAIFVLTADDNFELFVNGKKAGNASGHTRPHEVDATKHLNSGDNLLGVAATNTGENPAGLIGRLVVWTGDEKAEPVTFPIDASWKFSVEKPAKWDDGAVDLASLKPVKELAPIGQGPWGTPGKPTLTLPPPPYLRKPFTASKKVSRATIYATALGVYELHLNGKRVAEDERLSPGWTDYKKRVYARAYDVTGRVKQGDNVIGAILGDGWYAGYFSFQGKRALYGEHPRLRVQLDITYDDNSVESVVTDGSWKCTYGPEREGDLLQGASYDARMERKIVGWTNPIADFDDSSWKPALVDEKVKANVQPHPGDPVTVHERIAARKITEPTPGTYIFDLGQNMVGVPRLKLKNVARGTKVTLRQMEMLNPDGTLYTTSLRAARATDTYIAKGAKEETWEPKFTFHGFQYVEVTGLDKKPDLDTVEGVVMHTGMVRSGVFESSDKLVNQLHHNIIWGQKGNYLEIPTDCPQRDERLGWTGDAQFFINTATYNYDVAAFMKKWLVDLVQDAQHPDGTFADVAPDVLGGHGNVAWGDAAVIIPHAIWRMYGDTRVIRDHYDRMAKYAAFLEKDNKELLRGVGAYGDWLNLDDKTKPEVIGTAYFEHVTRLMSEMAAAIGKDDDARKFGDLADKVRAAWVKNFLNDDGSIKESGQTGYALAFTMDLIPADKKEAAAAAFRNSIERKNNHLATGFIGTPRLLPALTRAGNIDTAYQLFLTKTYPSWLFQVTLGATTMWERWDGWTPDRGFQDPGMNSFNHYAFGSVGEWMYRTAAGIDTESGGIAFKKIVIKPRLPKSGTDLTRASMKYTSIRGPIESSWSRDGETVKLTVVVPPNTTATVYVPVDKAAGAAGVTESGKPTTEVDGVKFLWTEGDAAVYRLQSGTYAFETKLKG